MARPSLLLASVALPAALAIRDQFHQEAAALSLEEGGHELCAPVLVADTCAKLNFETRSYFGTEADADTSIVHAAEIAEYLHASRSSVLDALSGLGLANLETNATSRAKDALAVSCAELCEKVVAAIPESLMPPESDLACYIDTDSAHREVQCDVDVSPGSMKGLRFSADYSLEASNSSEHRPGDSRSLAFDGVDHEHDPLQELEAHGDRDADFIYRRLANAFRIYPVSGVEAEHDDEAQDEVEDQAPCPVYCSMKSHCQPKHKLFHVCQHCEMCSDSARRNRLSSAPTRSFKTKTKTTSKSTPAWKKETISVGLKAQAYINQVYRNLRMRSVPHIVERWFGNNRDATRRKIFKVLASVDEVLDNVVYRYHPGVRPDGCDRSTYAYVYPEGRKAKNSAGKFIYHLCDTYMRADLGEKIETLTHEGSHHASAYTDDVCYSGSGNSCDVAYGRPTCKKLAKKSPAKALINADSYCYFINDAYDETN